MKNGGCRERRSLPGESLREGSALGQRRLRTARAARWKAPPGFCQRQASGGLHQPGHMFPVQARPGGVLEREGHTEATMDLMHLAGLKPNGVLCELANPDGSMARLPEITAFAWRHDMPLLTVQALVQYRRRLEPGECIPSEQGSPCPSCIR
ncbi:3,4-dihydroxy-2-butanone-4-phosphate synthase [Desulfocurvibacter africanus]